MENLTKSQKKILTIAVIGAVVYVLIWLIAYIPSVRHLSNLKSELAIREKQIEEIEFFTQQGRSAEESIALLQQRYNELCGRFPAKDEDGFGIIAEAARKLNIEVISLNSQPKIAYLDENRQPVTIEGKGCYRVPVTIALKTSYRDLVLYLGDLKSKQPVFVTIKQLDIQKESPADMKLSVNINLIIYILS